MNPSPIVYVEIPSPSVEKAEAFYRSVFSWQIAPSALSDLKYSMFTTGPGGANGGFDSRLRPARDGGAIFYVKVADIPAALRAVESAGGSVVREKFPIGAEYGFSAIFADPNGNQVGLWSAT